MVNVRRSIILFCGRRRRIMLPEVTVSVLLSGNNFTVDFENPERVFTVYARLRGNELNSILSFSFYIYEEIKIIKVVILFYIYTSVPVDFLLFVRVRSDTGGVPVKSNTLTSLSLWLFDREPYGARCFFS